MCLPKWIEVTPQYVRFIEKLGEGVTHIVPPRMDEYIKVNIKPTRFQNFGGPEDIFPYSIDEGFIDLTRR